MEEQIITPYLLYKDCAAMLDWLTEAFGFEEVLRYTGEEGYVNHAETRINGASVYMGDPGDHYRNPKELGQETVGIYVIIDDVDAHYERAKAAGAEITEEPTDQEYGHRRYTAIDPEGHHWYFAAPVKDVAPAEWGAAVSAS
jgi:PhnB protein